VTYAEQESMEYKATIKNDFDYGYQDGISGKAKQSNSQMYIDGYNQGFKYKGK